MEGRSLLLVAPRRLAWAAQELPAPGPHEILVQTTAGAISMGTELPQYMGTEREIVARAFPRMTGYESLGTVLTCGSEVHGLTPGDRVVAFYGHRTHALVPETKAIPVPAGV